MIILVVITLENVSKYFGKVKALDDITLKVNDLEFLTLLGPSGCGKTTTLRLIAGLETPTKGNIYFDNECVNSFSPVERNIAMVFQSYALYPHMTVFDNMSFPLRIAKVPKDETKRRVLETAKMLGIDDLLDRKPKQLSGGQRQRVALGRAVVRKPKIYLMDEPLSNLDAKLRLYMRAELIRLQKELKTTLIYVTHDQIEAMTMSSRIALMNEGKLLQVDPPGIVYQHPTDTWVASFIGSPAMNLIDCTMARKAGLAVLDAGEFSVNISSDIEDIIKKKAASPELTFGIRPECITVRKEKRTSSSLSFSGEIYVLEPIGESTIIEFSVGQARLRAKVSSSFNGKIGEAIFWSFDQADLHIFDKKTHQRIL